MDIFRGDIVYVDLEPRIDSETGRIRPCLVIQNDVINKIGHLDDDVMKEVEEALKIVLSIGDYKF